MMEIKIQLKTEKAIQIINELYVVQGAVGVDKFTEHFEELTQFRRNLKDQVERVVKQSDSIDKQTAKRKFAEFLSSGIQIEIPQAFSMVDVNVAQMAYRKMLDSLRKHIEDLEL